MLEPAVPRRRMGKRAFSRKMERRGLDVGRSLFGGGCLSGGVS